jgi:hypothetical protein
LLRRRRRRRQIYLSFPHAHYWTELDPSIGQNWCHNQGFHLGCLGGGAPPPRILETANPTSNIAISLPKAVFSGGPPGKTPLPPP